MPSATRVARDHFTLRLLQRQPRWARWAHDSRTSDTELVLEAGSRDSAADFSERSRAGEVGEPGFGNPDSIRGCI